MDTAEFFILLSAIYVAPNLSEGKRLTLASFCLLIAIIRAITGAFK
jgi:hypothetical protein